MKLTEANDAAFPSFPSGQGLSKREYFAAQAMQGMLANLSMAATYTEEDLAHAAVVMADELVAALEGAE